jgi:anti-sigma factor RsiW
MTCPEVPQVHAYHDGELPPAQRAAVESHIAGCEPCSSFLDDLREISRRVQSAPLPEVVSVPFERLYETWHVARDRGVLRITRWLTAAAAAILVGSLVLFPGNRPVADEHVATAAVTPSWEPVALMAPVVEDPRTTRGEELVEVAQWMADDLAAN